MSISHSSKVYSNRFCNYWNNIVYELKLNIVILSIYLIVSNTINIINLSNLANGLEVFFVCKDHRYQQEIIINLYLLNLIKELSRFSILENTILALT